ncbi:unnamed protein product [Closterium sp. NIES-54]
MHSPSPPPSPFSSLSLLHVQQFGWEGRGGCEGEVAPTAPACLLSLPAAPAAVGGECEVVGRLRGCGWWVTELPQMSPRLLLSLLTAAAAAAAVRGEVEGQALHPHCQPHHHSFLLYGSRGSGGGGGGGGGGGPGGPIPGGSSGAGGAVSPGGGRPGNPPPLHVCSPSWSPCRHAVWSDQPSPCHMLQGA